MSEIGVDLVAIESGIIAVVEVHLEFESLERDRFKVYVHAGPRQAFLDLAVCLAVPAVMREELDIEIHCGVLFSLPTILSRLRGRLKSNPRHRDGHAKNIRLALTKFAA